MNLYYNKDGRFFQKSQTDEREVFSFFLKRGDEMDMRVLPVANGSALNLSGYVGMRFVVKSAANDADPLILADSFVRDSGTGFYESPLEQDVDAIETLLEASTDQFIDVYSELEIEDADGVITSKTSRFRIYNDLWKGTEGTPISLPTPDEWLSDRAVRFDEIQTLTSGEKSQARTNIGAASTADLHSAATVSGNGISISGQQISLSIGTGSTQVAAGNDSRFTDARTPTAHKTSHATGGSDAITPADIGAAEEITEGREPILGAFWTDSEESLKLAISVDGVNFEQFATNLVSGPNATLRDPSLLYRNGYWYVAFTNNSFNTTTSFSIYRSADLLTWTTHATVSLSSISGLNRVWSPQLIVTSDGSVRVYVAGNDGTSTDTYGEFSIYHLLGSSDLSTWGTPTAVLSRSAGTKHYIDPWVVEESGTFYLFVKEEYSDYIEVASSSLPASGFSMIRTGDWAGWGTGKEGACIIKTRTGWRIYMDHYATSSGYKYDTSASLLSGWSGTLTLVGNTGNIMRHGSFYLLNKTEEHLSCSYAYISSLCNSTLPYGPTLTAKGMTIHNGLKIEAIKKLGANYWAQLILSHTTGTGTYKGAIMLAYNDQLQFVRGINADGVADPNCVMVDVPMGTRIWDFKAGIKVAGGPTWTAGTGSPEGVVTAPIGSLFSRTNGGAGTSLYVKQSGTGNTGWAAVTP